MDHWNDRSSCDSITSFLISSSRLAIQEAPSTILWDMGISFGGVWNARAQKGEGGTGNKLFQRLESLSDYTESKGWLEDKE